MKVFMVFVLLRQMYFILVSKMNYELRGAEDWEAGGRGV